MCRFQPSQTDQKRLLEHPFLTNCVEPPVFLFSRPRLVRFRAPKSNRLVPSDPSNPHCRARQGAIKTVPTILSSTHFHAGLLTFCDLFNSWAALGGFIAAPVSSGAITASSSVIRCRRRPAEDHESKICIPGSEKTLLAIDALLQRRSVSLFAP